MTIEYFERWYGSDPVENKLIKLAYEAGWNACADLNDSFTYDEVMSHLQEENTDDI